MSELIDFQPYLASVCAAYEKWWQLYTLTDAAGKQRQAKQGSPPFDFSLMVQTVKKEDRREEEKIERFSVLDGIRKYAQQHVLLVGRPGSGKSTALARLMLEEATTPQARIPVLVELRYWQGSIEQLIRDSFTRHEMPAELFEEALKRSLILFDGVNELPSEEARSQLSAFRRNHPKLPMIFATRDLSLGGDLGIEKKLEMQPLTETQMQAFIRAYVPEQAEQMQRQLKERLRQIGKIPLLLWIVCEVFNQIPNQYFPNNLSAILQVFTQMYEDSSVRKHEVSVLKGDVRPLSDRRLWKPCLKYLASLMMQPEKPMSFRTVLDRTEAEKELLKTFSNEQFPVRDILDDLLKYHLLQNKAPGIIEFRHQMIQEYYAAEWLMQDSFSSKDLDNDTLVYEYLNNRKWTEPISLMLGLLADEDEILRIVRLALGVDLFLGARLAGKANSRFHDKTVAQIIELNVPEWLKIQLLRETNSAQVIPILVKALESSDFNVYWWAAYSFKDIPSEEASPGLLKLLASDNPNLRKKAAQALGYLGSATVVAPLLDALQDKDSGVRREVAQALGRIGCKEAVVGLIELVNDADSSVREYAIEALGKIGSYESLPMLLNALEDQQSWTLRMKAAQGLGEIGSCQAVPQLIKALEDPQSYVREKAAEALSKIDKVSTIAQYLPNLSNLLTTDSGKEAIRVINSIQINCKYYNYEFYRNYLELQEADRQTQQTSDRSTTIYNFPNAAEAKIFENVHQYHEAPPKDSPS